MKYTLNQETHGFIVSNIQEIKELDATLYYMVHKKTKGQLIYLDRNDINMTFSVTMKTLPSDDTGVFHILEHSVLGGSKKYPVKEPFVELLKSSMNTFLNAMTFPDKTMYPVSSQNEQDFLNLTEVYLDAVFAPSIYTKKEIFMQEGWHYELDDQDAIPTYKGVVFNEMKGAFDNEDSYLQFGMNRLLYPDNCYQYESGGYPEAIPELTYEKFLQEHHKFYSFTNARFFIDGNAPIEKVLELIESYADDQEFIDMDTTIPMQEAYPNQVSTIEYPIEENEDTTDKTHFYFGKLACRFDEIEKIFAYQILTDLLAATNEDPLTKAILSKKLGQSVSFDLIDGIQQPMLSLLIKNSNEECLEELKETIFTTFEEVLKEGIDHKVIEADLSYLEFILKEKNYSYPMGVSLAIKTCDSWLYDGNPALYLENNHIFQSLRQKLNEGYFEQLLQELIDQKDYFALVIGKPSATLSKELLEKENEKLVEAKSHMSEQDIQTIIKENGILTSWQQSVDTKEQLDTIPQLKLSDIKDDIEEYPYEETTINNIPVVQYKLNSYGITYLKLMFSLKDIPQDKLSLLSSIIFLYRQLPTKNYDVIDINTYIKAHLGSLKMMLMAYPGKDNSECNPFLVVDTSFLDGNEQYAYDMINEILFNTKIDDKQKIKDIIIQLDTNLKNSLMSSGHSYGMKQILGAHSATDAFSELTDGYTFNQFIKDFKENFDEYYDQLTSFYPVLENIFTKGNMKVFYNGNLNIEKYINTLKDSPVHDTTVTYELLENKNNTISLPVQVSYATLGGSLSEQGVEYNASMAVLSKVVSLEYLWNEVRVKGGAYGVGLNINRRGNLIFYSYRDPSPMNSIETYMNTKKFIEEYVQTKDNVDKFIISTLSDLTLLSTPSKIKYAMSCYLNGYTDKQRQETVRQILNTKITDLVPLMNEIKKVIINKHYCIIGQ